jgi:hypothetical protein
MVVVEAEYLSMNFLHVVFFVNLSIQHGGVRVCGWVTDLQLLAPFHSLRSNYKKLRKSSATGRCFPACKWLQPYISGGKNKSIVIAAYSQRARYAS